MVARTRKKMALLCLHGFRTSATTLKAQLRMGRVRPSFARGP